MNNSENYFKTASEFIIKEGDNLLKEWNRLKIKRIHNDLVDVTTNFDIEIEQRFFNLIKKRFPDHGFMGEELTELDNIKEYTWYIDPIDGTKYFAHKIPIWNIAISLINNNKPILGLIYNPLSKQLFSAQLHQGSYVNNKKLQFKEKNSLSQIIISWDAPTTYSEIQQYKNKISKKILNNKINQSLKIYRKIYKQVYRIRALGCGTLSLTALAEGFFDVYFAPLRKISKDSDILAGEIIASELGLKIYKNKITDDFIEVIIASPKYFNYFVNLLKN